MAAPGPPSEAPLPLDDRSKDIFITVPIMIVFATTFVVIRMVVSWKKKKFFLLTDYLLILGATLNIGGGVFAILTTISGQGKHVWDPFITPEKISNYMRYLWWGQLLNIYAMTSVKGSICAYLFMLNFTKTFRILVWISVVIHITTNFIFPSVILFGECKPIAKHWNTMLPGYCWVDKPRVVSGYLGAATNIVTDLFYTSAPLVYISSVQLPRRTIWGVRAVFLLALVTTTISALKLYEIKALNSSNDPTYEAVDLTIFALTEVSVGTFTACLPPLRKTFENALKHILPGSFLGTSKKRSSNYELPAYGSQLSRTPREPIHENDGESEKAILPEEHAREAKNGGIMRTTHVSIQENNGHWT